MLESQRAGVAPGVVIVEDSSEAVLFDEARVISPVSTASNSPRFSLNFGSI